MFSSRKIKHGLVCLLLVLTTVGCQPAKPAENTPRLNVREGILLAPEERPELLAFDGTDLISDRAITFGSESQGRVRILSFFSMG